MPLGCVAALACGKSQSADKNEAPVIWGGDVGRSVIEDFEGANSRRDPTVGLGDAALLPQLMQAASPMGELLMSVSVAMKTISLHNRR